MQLSVLALKLALAGGPRVRGRHGGRLCKRRLEVRPEHSCRALALPTEAENTARPPHDAE